MDTEKTKRVYTLDEIKDKAKLASDVPKLVEIVKTAPLTKEEKINLTWVRDQAHQYVLEETGDVKDAKKLADSARFLAKLRQESKTEFEKITTRGTRPEIKETKEEKTLWNTLFRIPWSANVITEETQHGSHLFSIRFNKKANVPGCADNVCIEYATSQITKFCFEILEAMLTTEDFISFIDICPIDAKEEVKRRLIQIFENNFRLKVEVCGNCQHLVTAPGGLLRGVDCEMVKPGNGKGIPNWREYGFFTTCPNRDWAPKEVSEKKEKAVSKICESCRIYVGHKPTARDMVCSGKPPDMTHCSQWSRKEN